MWTSIHWASHGPVRSERTLLINGRFSLPNSLKLASFPYKIVEFTKFVNRIRRKSNSHIDVNPGVNVYELEQFSVEVFPK